MITTVEDLLAAQERGEVNPFYDYQDITMSEVIKCCLMFPIALIRLLFFIIFVLWGSLVACLLQCGCDPKQPYTPCRAAIVGCYQWVMARGILFLWGFIWIERSGSCVQTHVNGHRVVVVAAPHASLADALAVVCAGVSVSPVAIGWMRNVPFIGPMMALVQTIFVARHSKQSTTPGDGAPSTGPKPVGVAAQIAERVRSTDNFFPPLVFPEVLWHPNTNYALIDNDNLPHPTLTIT